MSEARKIPQKLLNAQLRASDPSGSRWVSANAGSGKTYVLAQRVMRLLLNGVDPAKILCLTFTKVAAANMSNSVFKRLAAWTALDDEALAQAIYETEGKRPDAERMLRARRLFTLALETPGGLKVQTIHAFCSAVMHQFPFESGVAARFEVMEDRAQDELINRVRMDVLLEAARTAGSPLARALSNALVAAADVTFAEVVRDAVGQRGAYQAWLERARSVAAAVGELDAIFGVGLDDTAAGIDTAMLAQAQIARDEWPAVAEVFQTGSANDQAQAARLRRAMRASGPSAITDYLDVFCTGDREPRKNIVTKKLATDHPELASRLAAEQGRICALIEERRAVVARDRATALATITFEILARYAKEKARRGLLDYDDLIEKTRALLSEGGSAWVMYKLDLGIDHVLIDEAQDTSPAQWEVIRSLTAEFFAGAGARSSIKRSIFAVGDEKQSIYSFQGAAPHLFDEMRRRYESEHEAARVPFLPVPLQHSFRSTVDVLGAVDEVFKLPHAHAGLAHDPVATLHEAVRIGSPGSVELWPLVEPAAKTEVEPWDAPFDSVSEESPPVLLARRIARDISRRIEAREPVESRRNAALRPGDILILVRQRGPLFEAVIRALKGAGVDVAGADRLVLTDHIAVMDLMALADALLLRDDDLALAEVLKSPLFGLSEEELFALAYGRHGTLRGSLGDKAKGDARLGEIASRLVVLEERSREEGPFAFYSRLLGAEGGRRQIRARLGVEADDALDEFLALAIEYERRNTPSLQGFVAWLRAANAEVKRDMDVVRDEVRVMTVHGAKGLEAPIVYLADTATSPRGPREPSLVPSDEREAQPILWLGRKAEDGPVSMAARARAYSAAEKEHLRLLYVAMTRAADKLVVCGARGQNRIAEGCWYALISEALKPTAMTVRARDGDGTVWRWHKSPQELELSEPAKFEPAPAVAAAPDWLSRSVSGAAPVRERVLPSGAASHAPRGRGPAPEAAQLARQRGTLVHRLLQSLPDVPEERREEAATRFLARHTDRLPAGLTDSLVGEVLAILGRTDFAPLFAAGSKAEVPVVGRIERAGRTALEISGQIDRLIVTDSDILIADFKTDRNPNADSAVAGAYVTQLALYGALLSRLYPGRALRAGLIWTEIPRFDVIAQDSLEREAGRLGVMLS